MSAHVTDGVLVRGARLIQEGKTKKGGSYYMLGIPNGPVCFRNTPAEFDVLPEGVVFDVNDWGKLKWTVNKVECKSPPGEAYRRGPDGAVTTVKTIDSPAHGKTGPEHATVTTTTYPDTTPAPPANGHPVKVVQLCFMYSANQSVVWKVGDEVTDIQIIEHGDRLLTFAPGNQLRVNYQYCLWQREEAGAG